jgi:hypothetical protein
MITMFLELGVECSDAIFTTSNCDVMKRGRNDVRTKIKIIAGKPRNVIMVRAHWGVHADIMICISVRRTEWSIGKPRTLGFEAWRLACRQDQPTARRASVPLE